MNWTKRSIRTPCISWKGKTTTAATPSCRMCKCRLKTSRVKPRSLWKPQLSSRRTSTTLSDLHALGSAPAGSHLCGKTTSWKSKWKSSRRWVTTWPTFTVLSGSQAGLGKYFLERFTLKHNLASQVGLAVKNLTANARDMRLGFNPWVGKIPWRRAWQPTPVFLPGEFHGQRSLAGYSLWGHKESDTTEMT